MLFVLASWFGVRRQPALERAQLEALGDEQLMERYAGGDVVAFEILLGRHERKLLNFVYRSVGDRDRATDLVQDIWVRVVKTADRYKPQAKFTTWLFTIARNACIDESRRRAKRRTSSLDAPISDDSETARVERVHDPAAVGASTRMTRDEFLDRLREGLAALPDEQREVFVLRHYEGMRFVEIAQLFGLSENTVKSRMRYALATLRGYVAEFEGTSFDADEADEVGADRE